MRSVPERSVESGTEREVAVQAAPRRNRRGRTTGVSSRVRRKSVRRDNIPIAEPAVDCDGAGAKQAVSAELLERANSTQIVNGPIASIRNEGRAHRDNSPLYACRRCNADAPPVSDRRIARSRAIVTSDRGSLRRMSLRIVEQSDLRQRRSPRLIKPKMSRGWAPTTQQLLMRRVERVFATQVAAEAKCAR